MQSNIPSNGPIFGGPYVPYFYQAGLYRWHQSPSNSMSKPSLEDSLLTYDFTSDLIRPRGHDHPQTVEQVITRGYLSVPYGDPMTALISDRRHTSWLGLDDLISQVRGRFAIYGRNMYELDQSVCEAHSALLRQVSEQGCPANEKQKYAADKMTQKLYEQKRAERLGLWQDISKLRLALPEVAQQYLGAYRKEYLLNSFQGDAP